MSSPDYHLDRREEIPARKPKPAVTNNSSWEADSILYSSLLLVLLSLVVLKQAHVLDWSWWWICLPLWVLPAGVLALVVVVLILAIDQEIKRARRGW